MDQNALLFSKAHLDKALEQAKLEVPPTAKAWDAERLYDKRLLGAMIKDKCTRLQSEFFC
jgi:cohesin complex subunit SA-1/2